MEEFHLKQDEIADRVAKSRTAVTNSMRLLKLTSKVQEMVIADMISAGHARALLGLEDGEQQYQVALKIVGEHLSVREVEKLVKALTKPKKPEKEKEEERDLSASFALFHNSFSSSQSWLFLTMMRIWMNVTHMMQRPRMTAIAEDMPATCFLTEFS